MAYTYDAVFAVDPNNPANVAKSASITIFNPADATQAPVAITDPTGSPLPNPMTLDAAGMGPAFQHPTLARVGWKGAGFTGYFTSYEGMYNETVAAKSAAQTALGAATQASTDAQAAANAAADAAAGHTFQPTNGITYNTDGSVSSVTEGGVTTTFTYNTDGTVNTETRLGKVRTWAYDANGNPTSSTVV